MKITAIETFILHIPVTRHHIEDSTHRLTHWGAPGVIIHTDAGITGYGYTGTHAHLPTDRLITDCVAAAYAPLLIGEDPREVRQLHAKLKTFPPIQWVGRSGITQLALSVVDIALWDIKAKEANLPLWKLLGGGGAQRIQAYNTDGGWLNWPLATLTENASQMVKEGYQGIKIKVGSPDPYDDLTRIAAVRQVIGPHIKLMVDANGKWDLTTARMVGRHFGEYDVYWFEEPLWFDDVKGHAILAHDLETPIALGEQLYTLDAFRDFIQAAAVHVVQADAVRLAGITEWWQVADLALAYRLPVVPHIGDMMQVHLHLCLAHGACNLLEYIPWLRECFAEPVTVENGYFLVPQLPGAGTTLKPTALREYGVGARHQAIT